MTTANSSIRAAKKKPISTRLKPSLRALHRWLGIFVATHMMLIGLTGSLLVWHRELDAWLNPEMLRPPTALLSGKAIPMASPNKIRDAAFAAIAIKTGDTLGDCSIIWPTVAAKSYNVLCAVESSDKTQYFDIFVHPQTAKITGFRNRDTLALDRRHLVRTIHEVHADLLLGDIGLKIVGISALILISMTISGLFLWWPPNRRALIPSLKVKFSAPARRSVYESHRTVGVLGSSLIVISAVSGLYLTFPEEIDLMAGSIAVMEPWPEIAQENATSSLGKSGDINALLATAHKALPGGRVTEVSIPADPTTSSEVAILLPGTPRAFDGTSSVFIDRSTRQVLHVRDARKLTTADSILESLFPLHSGEMLRATGRILNTLAGLLLTLLAASAIWLFAVRRRSKKT
jgi:uncharacterized iron-regulated membrane protein